MEPACFHSIDLNYTVIQLHIQSECTLVINVLFMKNVLFYALK